MDLTTKSAKGFRQGRKDSVVRVQEFSQAFQKVLKFIL